MRVLLGMAVWALSGVLGEYDDFYDDYDADSSNIHEAMIGSSKERCNDLSFDWEFVAWRKCPGCSRRTSVCAAGDMVGLDGNWLGGQRCLKVPPECLPYLKLKDWDPADPSSASRPQPTEPQPTSPAVPFPTGPKKPKSSGGRSIKPRCSFVRRLPPKFNRNTCGGKPRRAWKVFKGRCLRSRKADTYFCGRMRLLAAFGHFPTRKFCARACVGKGAAPSSPAGLSRRTSAAKRKVQNCTMRKMKRCAARFQARKAEGKSEGCLKGGKGGRRVVFHFRRTGSGEGHCRPSYYYGCRPDGRPYAPLPVVLKARRFNIYPSKKLCNALCCKPS